MDSLFHGKALVGLLFLICILSTVVSQQQTNFVFQANGTKQTFCPIVDESSRLKIVAENTTGIFSPLISDNFTLSPDGDGGLTLSVTNLISARGKLNLDFNATNGGTTPLSIDFALRGIYLESDQYEVSSEFEDTNIVVFAIQGVFALCNASNNATLDIVIVRPDSSCKGNRGIAELRDFGIPGQHFVYIGIINCDGERSESFTLISMSTTTEPTTIETTTDFNTEEPEQQLNPATFVIPILAVIIVVGVIVLVVYVRHRRRVRRDKSKVEDSSSDENTDTPNQRMNGGPYHLNNEIDGKNGQCLLITPNGKREYISIGEVLAERQHLTLKVIDDQVNSNDPSLPVMKGVRGRQCLVYSMLNGSAEHQNGINQGPANKLLQTLTPRPIDEQFARKIFFIHFSKSKDRLLKTRPSHVTHIAIEANPEESGVDPSTIADHILQEQGVCEPLQGEPTDPPPPVVSHENGSSQSSPNLNAGSSSTSLMHQLSSFQEQIDALRNELLQVTKQKDKSPDTQAVEQNAHANSASLQNPPALTATHTDTSSHQQLFDKFDAFLSEFLKVKQNAQAPSSTADQSDFSKQQLLPLQVQLNALRRDIQDLAENMHQEFDDARKDTEDIGNAVEDMKRRL